MVIRSDRSFRFDVDRPDVWAAMVRVESYRQWWPWLRDFDGRSFAVGEQWNCAVRPPLPYTLRFSIHLVDVVPHDVVRARIDGDIAGAAQLTLNDRPSGCDIRLVSELRPVRGALRWVGPVRRPIAVFGHDRILDSGIRQFRTAALADDGRGT